ncbi:MAG: type II toxin-antitoxin system Phd/YefM family antitoxin [Candidatus Levyibacteriota bacterium]
MTNVVVNVTQVRDNLSDILGRVKFGEEIVTVEKKGKPYAVIISPEQYEAYQKAAKEKLFSLVDKIQSRNTQYSEEEVMKDVTQVVEEVRQETYEQGK